MEVSGTRKPYKHEAGSGNCDNEGDSYIPIIRKADIAQAVPKYAAVLKESVCLEDVDQLQQDLEKLLTTCVLRQRVLKSAEDKRVKKRKLFNKTLLKRKRLDERLKLRDSRRATRLIKRHHSFPVNNIVKNPPRKEVPKIAFPKNDTSEKFWNSIEGYCTSLTKDDITFLDKIIQECTKDIDMKTPKLGEHYSSDWTDETVSDEASGQEPSGRTPKSKNLSSSDLQKHDFSAVSSTISHRLLASLIEQRITPMDDKFKFKFSPNLLIKDKPKALDRKGKAGICMERKLQKELVEQGILSSEDILKIMPEDEIATEIKKCQEELAAVNEYNLAELTKVKKVAAKVLEKQETKKALEKADAQILDLYNKILSRKRKHLPQTEEDEIDKQEFSEKIIKEFEVQADSLLKQQVTLNSEIADLNHPSLF